MRYRMRYRICRICRMRYRIYRIYLIWYFSQHTFTCPNPKKFNPLTLFKRADSKSTSLRFPPQNVLFPSNPLGVCMQSTIKRHTEQPKSEAPKLALYAVRFHLWRLWFWLFGVPLIFLWAYFAYVHVEDCPLACPRCNSSHLSHRFY